MLACSSERDADESIEDFRLDKLRRYNRKAAHLLDELVLNMIHPQLLLLLLRSPSLALLLLLGRNLGLGFCLGDNRSFERGVGVVVECGEGGFEDAREEEEVREVVRFALCAPIRTSAVHNSRASSKPGKRNEGTHIVLGPLQLLAKHPVHRRDNLRRHVDHPFAQHEPDMRRL